MKYRVLRKALSYSYDLEEQVEKKRGKKRLRDPPRDVMTPTRVLIARGSTRECELSWPYPSIRYLAIYIYPIYRRAPAAPDDKSDIATRDNFGALLPEKSNHIACR